MADGEAAGGKKKDSGVSIKVAIRCRPFSEESPLGVSVIQKGEQQGEVEIRGGGRGGRYAFSYAWWSAYGYEKFCTDKDGDAASDLSQMSLVSQQQVFDSCGQNILNDYLEGSPVVLFAYGLSGSGKTYTVFGPDAPTSTDAWYLFNEPHSSWGIFPRVAYEMFKLKQEGWVVTLKYFQNIVNAVRDLCSPMAEEKSFKQGLHKDRDGFLHFDWIRGVSLNSFEELCQALKDANNKKAISPTQFNHQSTRGHTILQLEVIKPSKDNPARKSKCRMYVCDLAGAEPAADIYSAVYEQTASTTADGGFEYTLKGPDPDQRKTKTLQDQGKKINLSLTEMAQFFLKMAKASKAKKLGPGASIPGCNSYFLNKYLKDTMLKAKTYLFCAIRPEVVFHRYTIATLNFAANASVVKLAPKKSVVPGSGGSAKEEKLLKELTSLKSVIEELQAENVRLKEQLEKGGIAIEGGMDAAGIALMQSKINAMIADKEDEIKKLAEDTKTVRDKLAKVIDEEFSGSAERMFEFIDADQSGEMDFAEFGTALEKTGLQDMFDQGAQKDLWRVMDCDASGSVNKEEFVTWLRAGDEADDAGGGAQSADAMWEEQRQEYASRGISLMHFEAETTLPFLVNLDEDPFRSNRFMYVLKPGATTQFGHSVGDIRPTSVSVVDDHCSVTISEGDEQTITLLAGAGQVFHNGSKLGAGESVPLVHLDRVMMGQEMMLFKYSAKGTDGAEPMSAEDAMKEYQQALAKVRIKEAAEAAEAARVAAEAEAAAAAAAAEAAEQEVKEQMGKFERTMADVRGAMSEISDKLITLPMWGEHQKEADADALEAADGDGAGEGAQQLSVAASWTLFSTSADLAMDEWKQQSEDSPLRDKLGAEIVKLSLDHCTYLAACVNKTLETVEYPSSSRRLSIPEVEDEDDALDEGELGVMQARLAQIDRKLAKLLTSLRPPAPVPPVPDAGGEQEEKGDAAADADAIAAAATAGEGAEGEAAKEEQSGDDEQRDADSDSGDSGFGEEDVAAADLRAAPGLEKGYGGSMRHRGGVGGRRGSDMLDLDFMLLEKRVEDCNNMLASFGRAAIDMRALRFKHHAKGDIEHKVHVKYTAMVKATSLHKHHHHTEIPSTRVNVLLDPDDLEEIHSTLSEETKRLKAAFARGERYRVVPAHLPLNVILDCHCPLVAKAAVGKAIKRSVETGVLLEGGREPSEEDLKEFTGAAARKSLEGGRRASANLFGAAANAANAAIHWSGGNRKGRGHEKQAAGTNKKKKKHTGAKARAESKEDEEDEDAEPELEPGEVKVPLKSVLPPHRSLAGHLVVAVSVATDDAEWDKTWNGLEGKEVTLTIRITRLDKLPFEADRCYCQYEIDQEVCTTDLDAMDSEPSEGPIRFDYEGIHVLQNMSKETLASIGKDFEVNVYMSPCVGDAEQDNLTTDNLALEKALLHVPANDESAAASAAAAISSWGVDGDEEAAGAGGDEDGEGGSGENDESGPPPRMGSPRMLAKTMSAKVPRSFSPRSSRTVTVSADEAKEVANKLEALEMRLAERDAEVKRLKEEAEEASKAAEEAKAEAAARAASAVPSPSELAEGAKQLTLDVEFAKALREAQDELEKQTAGKEEELKQLTAKLEQELANAKAEHEAELAGKEEELRSVKAQAEAAAGNEEEQVAAAKAKEEQATAAEYEQAMEIAAKEKELAIAAAAEKDEQIRVLQAELDTVKAQLASAPPLPPASPTTPTSPGSPRHRKFSSDKRELSNAAEVAEGHWNKKMEEENAAAEAAAAEAATTPKRTDDIKPTAPSSAPARVPTDAKDPKTMTPRERTQALLAQRKRMQQGPRKSTSSKTNGPHGSRSRPTDPLNPALHASVSRLSTPRTVREKASPASAESAEAHKGRFSTHGTAANGVGTGSATSATRTPTQSQTPTRTGARTRTSLTSPASATRATPGSKEAKDMHPRTAKYLKSFEEKEAEKRKQHDAMLHNEAVARAQAEAEKKEAEKKRRAEAAKERMEARRRSRLGLGAS